MILLVHFTGGVQSPLLFYFIFHLIVTSILLPRRACYLFATLAALAMAALALLEYAGVIPHVYFAPAAAPLYQNAGYVAGVLVFFTTTLYITVYLTTTLTTNLRQRDEELLLLQQRLSGAYQRMEALYDVSETVSSSLDLQRVLDLIAQSAAETMGVQACIILLVEPGDLDVGTLAAFGLGRQPLDKDSIDIRQNAHILATFTSGEPAIVPNVVDDDLVCLAVTEAEGIRSMVCVPLQIRGRREGVLCVYSTQVDHFEESDAEFLASLANSGASAVENARVYQALEEADRAKSDFVQMMTHEFRSPLSAVQSMLRLLELGLVGPLTPKQQDLIERSQRRIAFLLTLVKDLLELAAGKMELLTAPRERLSLREIIARVADLMQSSAEEKDQQFVLDLPSSPLLLHGFEEGLERVVMNLVSNAIKYTPAGGTVRVRAWSVDDQIEMEVTDTGIGIPEEARSRIFSEFYRAKNARALDVEGTGLGLVIAKDVVAQHGGRITVDSTVGEGSTFRVTLPQG
jgi:signal transduction histidine kinase